jgi:ATP-dependent DNA helicase RecQ
MLASDFLEKCLLLDIETCDSKIYHIGVVFGERTIERKDKFNLTHALEELDSLAGSAHYLLGHNLIDHDIPLIESFYPGLAFLKKPVVDTLFLSPLAFPENPYHRLVKDYKIVKSSLNNPVADAQLAGSVFKDEWESFASLVASDNYELPALYRFCFENSDTEGIHFKGLVEVFNALDVPCMNESEFTVLFENAVEDRVCTKGLSDILKQFISEPRVRPALAYCLAWLKVAGSNSIIPPWVCRRFPDVVNILHKLRDIPCTSLSCTYCSSTHSPYVQLKRYFGFSSFRPTPQAFDGSGLQEAITHYSMSDRSLLAIMPTGGGKSLCYQLPALVRYYRRGLLTIVISPLQALMKDQIDNITAKTGAPSAAALYGMLTPPERGEVLERLRLGDIALLYVSPEQLRNASFKKALMRREIGTWVFDEAHCISKWGHDFRPDYLYAARFIRQLAEEQKTPIPPIACFTATAKRDVKEEIIHLFKEELGQELVIFEGNIERENLDFEVQIVKPAHKYERIHATLTERLSDNKGAAVVYAATRREVENIAHYLIKKGWSAEAFHAGLIAPKKRSIQEDFIAGNIQVICATNAFGMGIDKEDIRLVLHADMPGSLENYLQEAGRAGRDLKDAECVLLYNESDVEKQFKLGALSKLSRRDIAQILRGLRKWSRNPSDEIVITTGELLRDEDLDTGFDSSDKMADTKVKTAVAWLERAGFIERNQNNTQVFQGQVLVKDKEEAEKKIENLNLSHRSKKQWLDILDHLMNIQNNEGISADELAEIPSFNNDENQRQSEKKGFSSANKSTTHQVLRALHDMAGVGLIKQGLVLKAYVRYKTQNNSSSLLKKILALENALLKLMQELEPDALYGNWFHLSLRNLCQSLKNEGCECNPETLRSVLISLSFDGRGLAGKEGSIELRHIDRDHYRIKLQRPSWKSLERLAKKRQHIADVTLKAIMNMIPSGTPGSTQLLVTFTTSDIVRALQSNMFLAGQITDMLAAADRALMFLHEQKVIILQQGLAVFRQAMIIHILPQSKGRKYTNGDYEPLSHYYSEKNFQVHVMNEYARLGAEKIRKALRLVAAYFTLSKTEFVKKYFEGRNDIINRATGQESYRKIVESLGNSVQIQAVSAHENKNILILAGPGSGKTRVVVHRCAYLLRAKRIKSQNIIMLCFNRNAALTIRSRLYDLVGDDARGVTILTYHGMAMRLTGTSFYSLSESMKEEVINFDNVIKDACKLLRGEKEIPGIESDELRDRLLSGYSHILVDEYQDIDENQYNLISALAGRREKDHDMKLAIMAVGDDDQNIYTFRGANIQFIKKFQEDYRAEIFYLVENYRSTAHIIAAANTLISHNTDRMKTEKPIVINKNRSDKPSGGLLSNYDPVSKGRIQVITVNDAFHQAAAIVTELKRLSRLIPDFRWSHCAVLTRTHETLAAIRSCLDYYYIPVTWSFPRKKTPPLFRVREIAGFISKLKTMNQELIKTAEIENLLNNLEGSEKESPWYSLIRSIIYAWNEEAAGAELPVNHFIDYLYETLTEQKRSFHFGEGVFLSTVHAAKGMEFPHVIIPDGGWTKGKTKKDEEEERRLFYVAMTRAQHSLFICERNDQENPHSPLLQGDFLIRRPGAIDRKFYESIIQKRFDILSMQDIFLDYAGWQSPKNPIHQHLSALKFGSPLYASLNEKDRKIRLLNEQKYCVAMLSEAAAKVWLNRLSHIEAIKVIAMIQREKKDVSEKIFKNKCHCEKWELPVAEVVYKSY